MWHRFHSISKHPRWKKKVHILPSWCRQRGPAHTHRPPSSPTGFHKLVKCKCVPFVYVDCDGNKCGLSWARTPEGVCVCASSSISCTADNKRKIPSLLFNYSHINLFSGFYLRAASEKFTTPRERFTYRRSCGSAPHQKRSVELW